MLANDFLKRVTSAMGVEPTSTYRTKEEQDELYRAGKTRLKGGESAHNFPDSAGDYRIMGMTTQEANDRLANAGVKDARVTYESGQGRNQGTGPHFHISQVTNQPRTKPVAASGASNLGWLHEALGEAPKGLPKPTPNPNMETGSRVGTVVDPFGSIVQTIASSAADTVSASQAAQTGVATENLKRDQITDDAVNEVMVGTAMKAEINEEQQTMTQAALEHLKPLFAKRAAIFERQNELKNMNPLARGFMSLFHRDYDLSALRRDASYTEGKITLAADEFKNIIGLQDTLTTLITNQQQGNLSVFDALMKDSDENLSALTRTLSAADTVLGASSKALSAETQVETAQHQARQSVLGTLTYAQALSARARAADGDGYVTVNGAVLGEGELDQVVNNWEAVTLNLEQARLGLQSAQLGNQRAGMALKDEKEKDALRRLPMPVLLEIGKAGGMYQGYQFDMTNVGNAVQARQEADQRVGGAMGVQTVADALNQQVRQFQTTNRAVVARTVDLLGMMPEPLNQLQRTVAARITILTKQMEDAKGNPSLHAQLKAQMFNEIGILNKEIETTVNTMAEGWAGGKKELVPLAKAWMTGQPISGTAAVDGLIAMVRSGSGPPNLKGAARQSFIAAQQAIQNLGKSKGGDPIEVLLAQGKVSMDDMRASVTNAVNRTYQGQISNDIVMRATEIGATIGHDAGKIPVDAYRRAIVTGDKAGYAQLATDLNTTPDMVEAAFGQNNKNAWAQINKDGQYDFDQQNQKLQAHQMGEMFTVIDSTVPEINGRKPSAILSSLFNDTAFQSRVHNMTAVQGNSNFGNFVMNSITGTASMGGNIVGMGQAMQMAQTQHEISKIQESLENRRLFADPVNHLRVALGPIEGLNEQEEAMLVKAIEARIPPADIANQMPTGTLGEAPQWAQGHNRMSFLLHNLKTEKFQDPGLERIRKIAAAGVDAAMTQSDAAIDRYHKMVRGK